MSEHPTFCTNCGHELGNVTFCPNCGQAAHASPTQPDAVREPQAKRNWKASPRNRVIVGVGALLTLVAVVVVALASSGASSPSSARTNSDATGNPETLPTARCEHLWNSDKNRIYRSQFSGLAARIHLYVSVGFAADYPDKCLVAISAPNLGYAWELLEGSPSPDLAFTEQRTTPDALPPSTKNWNAVINPDGTLHLPS